MVTTFFGVLTGATIPILMFIAIFRTLDSKYEKASERLSWKKIITVLLMIWIVFKLLIEPSLAYYYTTLFLIKINIVMACVMLIINKASFMICNYLNEVKYSKKDNKKT